MKKINLLYIILGLLSIITACKKTDLNEVQPVSLSLQIALDESISVYAFPLLNTEVKITNLNNGQVSTAKTDATGKANFASIAPGNYDVQAVLTVSASDYTNATGTYTAEPVVFNATIKSQSIIQNNSSLSLKLKTGRVGDWVMKQIYYAGSNTSNGAVFRDQFVEIYNNSNEVLYADSVCFAQVYGTNTKSNAIDFSKSYYRTNGQLDWTKAIDMNNAKANTDYVYVRTLYMIPGTGKQYPVQPGKSIIIAATALNHQAAYVGADGKAITVKDPSLTIDLSKADFETYLGNYPGISPLASDVDVPAVTNVKVIDAGGNRDLVMDATGRDAYVIFKTSEDITKWPTYASPDVTAITTTTTKYIQVPAKFISDGVEIQPPVATNQVPKKLEPTIDAGYNFVSKGQYSSQSLIRKTSKTVNGRVVLQDTNNSTNDFTELNIPDVTKTVFK